jgi:predicted transposase/invertase (TIGR01784 family)
MIKEEIRQHLNSEEIAYLESLGLNLDSDLLDPKIDSVFKAMLTADTAESREALKGLLGAAIGRKIKTVEIRNNEMAVTGLLQKKGVFDIHVTFDEGDEADIEMMLVIKDSIPNRLEFYTARLYCSQDVRGKTYADLHRVYTIMILNSTLFPDSENFYDEFMYRNKEGKVLSGSTQIITIELSKLDRVIEKPVPEMTDAEQWAVYLKYANHADKQALIQNIKDSQEGIRMGAQVLETISRDRDEFLVHFYQLKAEIDHDSQLLYAEDKVRTAGKIEGKIEGAVNIVRKYKATVTDALDTVELPEEERGSLIKELNRLQIPYED